MRLVNDTLRRCKDHLTYLALIFAFLVDLVLRLTWSAKLSTHLHAYSEGDLIIFWIELAEVVRRWMWVFLRVEWEVVREREVRATVPPGTRLRRRAPDASTEQEFELLRGASPGSAGVDTDRESPDSWRGAEGREL